MKLDFRPKRGVSRIPQDIVRLEIQKSINGLSVHRILLANLLIVRTLYVDRTGMVVFGKVRHLPIQRHTEVVPALVTLTAQFPRSFHVVRSIGR